MSKKHLKIWPLLLLVLSLFLSSCAALPAEDSETDERIWKKDEVALYIHEEGELPPGYITKKEARKLGWDARQGNLWEVAPGASIGGDCFGNFEGLLPDDDWHECDVDYEGGFRGPERLVYTEEGAVYYTEDHYQSFDELYGEGD